MKKNNFVGTLCLMIIGMIFASLQISAQNTVTHGNHTATSGVQNSYNNTGNGGGATSSDLRRNRNNNNDEEDNSSSKSNSKDFSALEFEGGVGLSTDGLGTMRFMGDIMFHHSSGVVFGIGSMDQ